MGPNGYLEVRLHPTVTKLACLLADTSGMDGREIEARMLMWAVAEISWEDASGQHYQASAVLEDRSNSGACVRLTRPVAVGSVVTIRWQREQFSAVARNCRDFARSDAASGTSWPISRSCVWMRSTLFSSTPARS